MRFPGIGVIQKKIGRKWSAKRSTKRQVQPGNQKLGAFMGVYTPTILTILGVIMYLRFGWVLGSVGLTKTLFIVLLANGLTLITALCLSAIATNSRVGVGGAYFIISRSMGLDIGGAIGVPLYLSQVLSVTLYAFGLAESLRIVWPGIPIQVAAFIIILLVGALSLRGAKSALKAQLPIMGLIAISLLALGVGSALSGSSVTTDPTPDPTNVSFWAVFAVFFPAVTGVMAGLGLSGDLEDPRKSIPKGTLLASITGLIIYLSIPFILSMGASRQELVENPLIWTKIAILGPWLILPGLWGAIFSSAVGSMLGAPRTLQALSFDGMVPRFFSKQAGPHNEPIPGLVFSLALCLGAVFLGDLNTVAVVVTMFFLTVYGMVSLLAALETLSENPSWRPRIKIPWWISMIGALGCLLVMILIHPAATALAIVVELLIWLWFKRLGKKGRWGNIWRDVYGGLIHYCLHALERHPMSARNWRPHILVFTGNVDVRLDLVRFASWFSRGRGLVTVCELIEGDLFDLHMDRESRRHRIDETLSKNGIDAFGEVNIVHNVESGMVAVSQANGIGNFSSNTVMIGWSDDIERLAIFLRVARSLEELKKSFLIGNIRKIAPAKQGQAREIHIWWGGLQRNGDLILLLGYLLTRSPDWHHARIHIMSIASNPLMKRKTEAFLEQLIPEVRISAEVNVMLKDEQKGVTEMIHETSGTADLVLLGLAIPNPGEEKAYAQKLTELVDGLDNFFLVRNGSVFLGDLILPEQASQEES